MRGILQHLPASVHLKVITVISNDTYQGFNPDKRGNCTIGKCIRGLSYIINYNYCANLTIKEQKEEEKEEEKDEEERRRRNKHPIVKKRLLSFFHDLLRPCLYTSGIVR